MADSIITKQELIDAQKDAQTLEEVISGEPGKLVETRLGRKVYTLASVPQINTMTREEIDTVVASRAPQATTYTKTEVDSALSQKAPQSSTYTKAEVDSALSQKAPQSSTYTKAEVDTTFAAYVGGRKAYTTLALAQADQVNLTANTAIEVTNDGANNGTYQWNGTTLTKSAYDPLAQAKDYTNQLTNKNLFNGFDYQSLTASSYTAGTNQTKTSLIVNNVKDIIQEVRVDGSLNKNINIYLNASSFTFGSGTPRVLVQIFKKDGGTVVSQYVNIPNIYTSGWFKLVEHTLAVAPELIDFVRLTYDMSNGASITVADVYVGSHNPNSSFVRVKPQSIEGIRSTQHVNLIPSYEFLPIQNNVSYSETGITIAASSSFTLNNIPLDAVSELFINAIFAQSVAGQLIFKLTAKPADDSGDIIIQRTSPATQELESAFKYVFAKLIKSVSLVIQNTGSTPVTIKNPMFTYEPAYQPQIKKKTSALISSDSVVDLIGTNIAYDVNLESSFADLSATAIFNKDGTTLTGGQYALISERKDERFINGETVYLSLPNASFALNTGTISIVVYQQNATGGSLGGTTYAIKDKQPVFYAPIVINPEAVSIVCRVTANGDSVVQLKNLYIGRTPLTFNRKFTNVVKLDETGLINSFFPYPQLTGYTRVGNAVEYTKTVDINGDTVLEIPVTGAATQGLYWNMDIPQNFQDRDSYLTLEFKCASYAAARFNLTFFSDAGNIGATGGGLRGKIDGSWTVGRIRIPARYNDQIIRSVRIQLTVANTSPSNLIIKRLIYTNYVHNPYVRHINNLGIKQSNSVPKFKRLTEALVSQPQGIFSVGKQVFRPLKSEQFSLADYELIGGVKNMPSVLRNKMYVDGGSYRIATIDSNDDFILHKYGTGNLYRLKPSEFFERFVKSSIVSGEQFATFNDTGLTPFTTTFSNSFLRIAADGTFIGASRSEAKYSVDGGVTWNVATGYQDTEGDFYNAWGFNTADNVVLTSGYRTAPNRQTGKVNYSNDYGRTYKVIFDVETASILSTEARARCHIHSTMYDKYAKRVWMVLGDYYVPTENMTGKILYCDNPDAATPVWNVMTSGADYYAEQPVTIYPLEDCVLFGSDATRSGIYRMAREVGDLRTDQAVFLHNQLAYYGCGGWQQSKDLPMAIYMGRASEYVAGDVEDKVFLTYDGVNYSTIVSDNPVYAGAGGKVDSFPFALRNHFVLDKRGDNRFASKNTWLVGTF